MEVRRSGIVRLDHRRGFGQPAVSVDHGGTGIHPQFVPLDGVGLVYAAVGLAALTAALLPRLLAKIPVSMPMVFLGAGMVAFVAIPTLPTPDLLVHVDGATHLAELCVIISLMGAGLALDRPVGWRRWGST